MSFGVERRCRTASDPSDALRCDPDRPGTRKGADLSNERSSAILVCRTHICRTSSTRPARPPVPGRPPVDDRADRAAAASKVLGHAGHAARDRGTMSRQARRLALPGLRPPPLSSRPSPRRPPSLHGGRRLSMSGARVGGPVLSGPRTGRSAVSRERQRSASQSADPAGWRRASHGHRRTWNAIPPLSLREVGRVSMSRSVRHPGRPRQCPPTRPPRRAPQQRSKPPLPCGQQPLRGRRAGSGRPPRQRAGTASSARTTASCAVEPRGAVVGGRPAEASACRRRRRATRLAAPARARRAARRAAARGPGRTRPDGPPPRPGQLRRSSPGATHDDNVGNDGRASRITARSSRGLPSSGFGELVAAEPARAAAGQDDAPRRAAPSSHRRRAGALAGPGRARPACGGGSPDGRGPRGWP